MREVTTQLSREAATRVMTNDQLVQALLDMSEIGFQHAIELCHSNSNYRGWWHKDGELLVRNIGELICLMHSELSEAMEGARKDLPSDHIEGFSMLEEELADTLVRIFDLAGALNLKLPAAFVAKTKFNSIRQDHSDAARSAEGGKKF